MMDKFRIALSFIKITFTNISNTLLKSATGYIVASFALIQVSSIVTDNISMIDLLGLPKETHESLQLTLDWFLEQRVIDEVQTSVLDIGPFIEDLAGVIDFSDHS